ncbi:MAG: MerR family transcriptional regulator [Candidatus Neomarinimicrobiota bacterium]|tara:strand:+ start:1139 stop:1510 length:372 start_codon:yes stop_codon:yes gene_type:complete
MNSNTNSIKKLYYSIGEVSKITDLKQYVLRYWETEFKQLNPNKNKAGNRTYRQKDIDTILQIKNLLYKEKFTIVGARKMLMQPVKDIKVAVKTEKKVLTTGIDKKTLVKIRSDLKSILDDLQN